MKGNFSIPLCSMGWEGCLGQGSLLSLRARRGSLLGSLWDHGWEARKETVQLVPHLLRFWWKVLGLQNQYFPPLWLGNPPGFSSPNLYPVIAPLPRQRSPCHSRFCRLAHEKGRSRLPSLGPRSPRRPASYFPPPARSMTSVLRQVCNFSCPWPVSQQSPSGKWIGWAQPRLRLKASAAACSAVLLAGMPLFPGLGTSARSLQPRVYLRHKTSSLRPDAVTAAWLWSLPFFQRCFQKHQSSASFAVYI